MIVARITKSPIDFQKERYSGTADFNEALNLKSLCGFISYQSATVDVSITLERSSFVLPI